jgi:hypothetical protein
MAKKCRSIFRTRYRIVRDGYAGYAAEFRWFWCPFWFECFFVNTRSSLERAKEVVEAHRGKTVWDDSKEVIDNG